MTFEKNMVLTKRDTFLAKSKYKKRTPHPAILGNSCSLRNGLKHEDQDPVLFC